MTEALPVWTERHAIRASEMDFRGHLSVRALCDPQGWTWVLREWQFEMAAWPRWRQEVTIETWPSGLNEMVATRDFRLLDGDGQPIGRATSRWMVVDFRRRRPIRMPDAVRAIRRPERAVLAADTLPRAAPDGPPGLAVDYRVRFADLDINEHVNNVSYVEWVLETVPREVLRGATLAAMTTAFRAECRSEATVTVERWADPERSAPGRPAFLHRVLEKEGARELAAARTLWRLE
ncbi:MAG: thioesterase [Acidobacteria bacterium]|nr:thioesterase [Acidobacteriota bacterium]